MSATMDPLVFIKYFEIPDNDFDEESFVNVFAPVDDNDAREKKKLYQEYFHQSIINVVGTTPYELKKYFIDDPGFTRLVPDTNKTYTEIAGELAIAIHTTFVEDLTVREDFVPPIFDTCAKFSAQDISNFADNTKSRNILIFVPTVFNIIQVADIVSRIPDIKVVKLFRNAGTNIEDWTLLGPGQNRIVIIATNIAETGITIPGIRYVIDTGLVNEVIFNPILGIDENQINLAPRNSQEQRHGRAGRTTKGVVYCLYPRAEMEKFPVNNIPTIISSPFSIPLYNFIYDHEIMKSSGRVFDIILDTDLIDLPAPESIFQAYSELFRAGFINSQYRLTTMGKFCIGFGRLDPALSRLLYMAPYYHVTSAIVIIVSLIQNQMIYQISRSALMFLPDDDEKFYVLSRGSDLLVAYYVYTYIVRNYINIKKNDDGNYVTSGPISVSLETTYENFHGIFKEIYSSIENIKSMMAEIGIPSWDFWQDYTSYYGRVLKVISEAFAPLYRATWSPEYNGWIPHTFPKTPFSVCSTLTSAPKIIFSDFIDNQEIMEKNIALNYPAEIVYYGVSNIGKSLAINMVSPYIEPEYEFEKNNNIFPEYQYRSII